MDEITRTTIARVGVDLSKWVFQVHTVDRAGRVLLAKPMTVDRFFAWCTGCARATEERAALVNRIRGLLAEFGLVVAQSPDALRRTLPALIEDATNELIGVARLALQRAQLHWIDIELQMAWCDERIACHVRSDERATRAAQLLGVGPVTASALVAAVGDFSQFRNARQFGAWLGWCPASTPPAANPGSGTSPSAVTTTCARC